VVLDPRARLVHEHPPGPVEECTDAQLGLLAADGPPAHASDLRGEASHRGEDLAAERHVRADQVADGGRAHGQPAIAAPDDPVELVWKPPRAAAFPDRLDGAARAEGAGVLVAREEGREPARLGDGIVVEERDDVTRRRDDPGVPRRRESARPRVLDHDDVTERVPDACGEQRVVVDRDDNLVRGNDLPSQRLHRRDQLGPAPLRVRADDHRHHERLHAAKSSRTATTLFRSQSRWPA
jgi:hypothetical protein